MDPDSPDDGWRLPDELWSRMEPLLPPAKAHPLGCHRPRVPNRSAMDAIFLLLRTGMQWRALDSTGICTCSSAYRRFREWLDAGVFVAFWKQGLLECEQLDRIDWGWLALDGTMTKAPLGGEKNRPQPYRPRQKRCQAQYVDRCEGPAIGHRGRACQSPRCNPGGPDPVRAGSERTAATQCASAPVHGLGL